MLSKRITEHPILKIPNKKKIKFYWNQIQLNGVQGETISSALFANNIHVFGYHHKDGSPQGLFCANGQCSQCMVIANNIAVKSCMTQIEENMKLQPLNGLHTITKDTTYSPKLRKIKRKKIPVLIIGGGPAGLSAGIELGKLNIKTIIIDDKNRLGGKLVLQTHKFFGSVEDSYAGIRGFKIGEKLTSQLESLPSIEVWLNSTVIGVFSDGIVGVFKNDVYSEILPEKLLVATGAREKMLSFPGNTLPGVYGAGAFQTLVNRDLVKPSDKILIAGGGNVGLIAGYHALQAGMKVVALVEAMPETGGYKVHSDKLIRMGVPIITNHTVVSAQGDKHVQRVVIAELDNTWKAKIGTHKTFEVDTVLIAVGLSEVNEFYLKATQWNMDAFIAGDAQEISEASAAIFAGKIEGLKIAKALKHVEHDIPKDWNDKAAVLKSKPSTPNTTKVNFEGIDQGVIPVFHCFQEVPCNPCTSVCPEKAIKTENGEITGLPYMTNYGLCKGCMACVAVCPGLAITLVDYRKNNNKPTVTLPYEMQKGKIKKGSTIVTTDVNGILTGNYIVKNTIAKKKYPGTLLVQIQADKNLATKIVGIQSQKKEHDPLVIYDNTSLADEAVICRCERVTAGEVRNAIKDGVNDLNHMKAINRIGMGACGSKTCRPMIWRIFQEEGIDLAKITDRVDRPLFVEVPIGVLAGMKKEGEDDET